MIVFGEVFIEREAAIMKIALTIKWGSISISAMQEKRASQRIGFNPKIALIQEGGGAIEVLRPNIGWGGLGGYTRDPVEAGKGVSIEVFFEQRSGETISEKLSGKIVWTRRDGNFNAFGISFEVNRASHPRLLSYLQYIDQND